MMLPCVVHRTTSNFSLHRTEGQAKGRHSEICAPTFKVMAAQRFKGRAAVVTGGSSGIGAALCRRLALSGIRVVIADVNERR